MDYRFVLIGILSLLLLSCNKNENNPVSNITTDNMMVTIDENPASGQILGSISASSDKGALSYSLISESATGAFALNVLTGELSVANKYLFNYEAFPSLTAVVAVTDGIEKVKSNVTVNLNDLEHIWTGTKTIFFKSAYGDPELEKNQDRITENVWITRGSSGPLFNALSADGCAPAYVKMAFGSIAELETLTFSECMEKLDETELKELPGKDLVFYLTADDTYIDVHFISWSSGSSGGEFSYERSTPTN